MIHLFINVEISLRDAADYNLDVTVVGQGFSEFVYESRKDGNMIHMYEKSKKLDDITYREWQSTKRKLAGVDRELF